GAGAEWARDAIIGNGRRRLRRSRSRTTVSAQSRTPSSRVSAEYSRRSMTFDVAADAYDRLMGRYSGRLAPDFADFADPSGTVLDVGCGPGALTAELVARVGADRVVAVDPSEPFVAAARARFPGVSVHLAPAESLPLEDGAVDAALAQLVVHFMSDPVGGVR